MSSFDKIDFRPDHLCRLCVIIKKAMDARRTSGDSFRSTDLAIDYIEFAVARTIEQEKRMMRERSEFFQGLDAIRDMRENASKASAATS